MKTLAMWLVVVGLAACKGGTSAEEEKGTPTNPVSVCTKDGQSCVHSEGKLGVCSVKLGPGAAAAAGDGGLTFTCMSLH